MSRHKVETRQAIERASERIRRELEARHPATVEAGTLLPIDPEEQRAGSKPLFTLKDPAGGRYVLKVAPPALMAAEEASSELRVLGRRPAMPARIVTVDLGGGGPTAGLLKPYLEFDVSLELGTDTTTWSDLQRGVLLREHAWEWFLDNMDTNPGQYALIGPERFPVNIDWDRSFSSDSSSELTRFAKYRSLLPNARNFLYADYVEGRISLDFSLLEGEARRVRNLPTAEVRRIASAYASVRFSEPLEIEDFLRRLLLRQANIESEVAYFVHALKRERRQSEASRRLGTKALLQSAARRAWKQWQRVLNAGSRSLVGVTCRRILSAARGHTLLGRDRGTTGAGE